MERLNLTLNDDPKILSSSLIPNEIVSAVVDLVSTLSELKTQNEFHSLLANLGKELYSRYGKSLSDKNEKSGQIDHKLGITIPVDEHSIPNKSDSSSEPLTILEQPIHVSHEINQEYHYSSLIKSIGEDISREGLLKTPSRAAKALRELTIGYTQNIEVLINDAIYESSGQEMVVVKDIELYSLCEHHLLPFLGKCHVGYIPNGKVIGLSKVARIVDLFARRLQIQENLTNQIAKTLQEVIDAEGVAVIIEAEHLCMRMRGVGKQNSVMQTSTMLAPMDKAKRVAIFRKENFNAAHRIFNSKWSDEKNTEIFGKCANPNYHGHNYDLIVKLVGELDIETGYVYDLKKLGAIMREKVLDVLDHKNLNLDVKELEGTITSTENLAIFIYERMRPHIDAKIDLSVRLYESKKNFVEYPAQ